MHTLCLASLCFALEEEDQKGIVLALQTQDPLEGWVLFCPSTLLPPAP